MKKFDPLQWSEVNPNEEIQAPEGRLRLRLSEAAPVYVTAHGVEVLAGIASEIDAVTSAEMTFRVEGDVRAFLFSPLRRVFSPGGEAFTNADRMPMESGTVAEVSKALRLFKLEQRALVAEVRSERAALQAERAREPEVEAEVIPADAPEQSEVDPEPEPEPAPTAKAKAK